MASDHYSYRPNIFSRERKFWLEPNAIGWSRGNEEGHIAFRDVAEARHCGLFMPGDAAVQKKVMWRLHVRCHSGEKLVLSPLHYLRARSWQDRSAEYWEFVNRLLSELRHGNPNLPITAERHWTMRLHRSLDRRAAALGGHILAWSYRACRNRDPDGTINAAARLMRHTGPLLRHHRVARTNLTTAFPEKSSVEIDSLLRQMWDNFGRVIAEYAFLEQLWDFSGVDSASKRIVIEDSVLEKVVRIRERGKPVLFFGAHCANWELLPIAVRALGLKAAWLYRPPSFGPVAQLVIDIRTPLMGTLIPARRGAALSLKHEIDHGTSIGMLVDQHFAGGIDVTFFGRLCKANPTLGSFARYFDCPIYGCRTVRLPNGRFRLELTDSLLTPRDADGKVDVASAMQAITSVIEGWVREYPHQWFWMHRRWR
jgi:KDO2-lipid IV(A) lauroyltransferase